MLPCGYDNKRVRVRANGRVMVNVKDRVRIKVRILYTVTIKYIGIFVIKESGLIPSPSLLQKHSLTGVTSFEVYVSDITGRRFEKVKNGHIFGTGRRCESYIYLPRDSNDMRFNALNKMN